MLRIPDFTAQEIKSIKEKANFTAQEERLFDLRNGEHSLEECAEIMNVSVSTVKRVSGKMTAKIFKVL